MPERFGDRSRIEKKEGKSMHIEAHSGSFVIVNTGQGQINLRDIYVGEKVLPNERTRRLSKRKQRRIETPPTTPPNIPPNIQTERRAERRAERKPERKPERSTERSAENIQSEFKIKFGDFIAYFVQDVSKFLAGITENFNNAKRMHKNLRHFLGWLQNENKELFQELENQYFQYFLDNYKNVIIFDKPNLAVYETIDQSQFTAENLIQKLTDFKNQNKKLAVFKIIDRVGNTEQVLGFMVCGLTEEGDISLLFDFKQTFYSQKVEEVVNQIKNIKVQKTEENPEVKNYFEQLKNAIRNSNNIASLFDDLITRQDILPEFFQKINSESFSGVTKIETTLNEARHILVNKDPGNYILMIKDENGDITGIICAQKKEDLNYDGYYLFLQDFYENNKQQIRDVIRNLAEQDWVTSENAQNLRRVRQLLEEQESGETEESSEELSSGEQELNEASEESSESQSVEGTAEEEPQQTNSQRIIPPDTTTSQTHSPEDINRLQNVYIEALKDLLDNLKDRYREYIDLLDDQYKNQVLPMFQEKLVIQIVGETFADVWAKVEGDFLQSQAGSLAEVGLNKEVLVKGYAASLAGMLEEGLRMIIGSFLIMDPKVRRNFDNEEIKKTVQKFFESYGSLKFMSKVKEQFETGTVVLEIGNIGFLFSQTTQQEPNQEWSYRIELNVLEWDEEVRNFWQSLFVSISEACNREAEEIEKIFQENKNTINVWLKSIDADIREANSLLKKVKVLKNNRIEAELNRNLNLLRQRKEVVTNFLDRIKAIKSLYLNFSLVELRQLKENFQKIINEIKNQNRSVKSGQVEQASLSQRLSRNSALLEDLGAIFGTAVLGTLAAGWLAAFQFPLWLIVKMQKDIDKYVPKLS